MCIAYLEFTQNIKLLFKVMSNYWVKYYYFFIYVLQKKKETLWISDCLRISKKQIAQRGFEPKSWVWSIQYREIRDVDFVGGTVVGFYSSRLHFLMWRCSLKDAARFIITVDHLHMHATIYEAGFPLPAISVVRKD